MSTIDATAAGENAAATHTTTPENAAAAGRCVVIQLRMAVACIALAVFGGALSVLHYIPAVAPTMNELGLTLPKLRPLHTTYASLWIFGAAIGVAYHFLGRHEGGLTKGDLARFRFHTICWSTAAVGVLVTLAAGITSGREYLGFHPALSALFLAGWLAFAWTFLKRSLRSFWQQPIYVWFWTVGTCYFVYTFIEGHAYLLPWVQDYPIRDLQLQWKACGTLVGSFNFLVYGCLIYCSERLTGDKTYAQSPIAFWLFGVGCLNSFTNYVHHTYHLPQIAAAKWIAFVVSMLEIVILFRVVVDLHKMVRASNAPSTCAVSRYFTAAKWWTGAVLATSILISVPSLNSYIHGTHVVTGHAMGAELGIDTMVLLGAATFVLADLHRRSPSLVEHLHAMCTRRHVTLLNLSGAGLVTWLTVSGTAHGIYRYYGEAPPAWVGWGSLLFPILGAALAVALLLVAWHLRHVLAQPASDGPQSDEPATSAT